jgi:small-conductance mechanosensitive channel
LSFPAEESNRVPAALEGNPVADNFYAGAVRRIQRIMPVLAVVVGLALWVRTGLAVAFGFLVGAAVAYLNFRWLERVAAAVADAATQTGTRPSTARTVRRFMLRYFLVALALYVIFRSYPASLYGLLAGLFLPVAAIACEAVYEVFVALRRGL